MKLSIILPNDVNLLRKKEVFILPNLFLPMLAAIQAPIIMMSQNHQDTKDRLRSELDYRVNLKAELEIEEILQRVGKLEEMLVERAGAEYE